MFLYINRTSSHYCARDSYLYFPANCEIAGAIGLSEINFELNEDPVSFDVCCDICETSLTQEDQVPILRRIYASKKQQTISFDPIHYVQIIKPQAPFLKVYLRPVSNRRGSVDIKTLQCTLHVREQL